MRVLVSSVIAAFAASAAAAQAASDLDRNERASLRPCGSYEARANIAGYTSGVDGELYLSLDGGIISALDQDRRSVWTVELGGRPASGILASRTSVFTITMPQDAAAAGAAATLRALSKQTGITIWSVKIPLADRYDIGFNGMSVVAAASNGIISAFDAATGSSQWRKEIGSKLSSPAVFNDGTVVFGTDDKNVVQIKKGEIASRFKIDTPPLRVLISEDGKILTGDRSGRITLLDGQTGRKLWRFKSGGEISYLAETKHGFVAGSYDNFIYSIWKYNGDVLWKRRIGARVVGGIAASDDVLASMVYGEPEAFVFDASNGKIRDRLILSSRDHQRQTPFLAPDELAFAVGRTFYWYRTNGCENEKAALQ